MKTKTAGSTMSFAKESAAFALALSAEHFALGALLENLAIPEELRPVKSKLAEGVASAEPQKDWPDAEILERARKAHGRVQYQRTRTEAARARGR